MCVAYANRRPPCPADISYRPRVGRDCLPHRLTSPLPSFQLLICHLATPIEVEDLPPAQRLDKVSSWLLPWTVRSLDFVIDNFSRFSERLGGG